MMRTDTPQQTAETAQVCDHLPACMDEQQVLDLRRQIAAAEPMAAVGRLTARVAHEMNNLLDGVLRYVNLGIRASQSGQGNRIPDYLEQARGGLLRISRISRELVEFARSAHGTCDITGVNAAVVEALRAAAHDASGAGLAINCRLADNMPATGGTGLYQVFFNLIKNAIDAMPQGGTLTILTELIGDRAVIRFEDTGPGLPGEIDRIFEPFFTTKQPGKGTGLGLAICKDLVEKLKGTIAAGRSSQGGASFTITLPARA
jgi:two-component system, NtrC family, sensor kinase